VRSPRKPPTARRSRLAARLVPAVLASPGHDERSAPFSPAPVLLLGKRSPSVGWCVRPGSHRSPRSALRVARDRPFRACGRSPHRPRPFRAKMNLVSTPALHPFGSSGPRLRRPRRTWLRRGERGMRWPLAPGGRRAVLVGATSCRRALARAQGALAKARARARRWFCRSVSSENRDVAASRCRRVRAFGLW